MRSSIRVPIVKMIDLLDKISSGGGISRSKSLNSNTSKISFLFKHEISMFYSHFTLTRNLLKNSTDLNSAVKYQILFKKYLLVIFSMFFKIKPKSISKKRKISAYYVKCLPNFRLYEKTKKLIDRFMEKEEKKFNLSKIKKNMFIINGFLDIDDENTTDDDSKNENNNKNDSVNININTNIDNC